VPPTKEKDPRAHHVVVLSARTPNALAGNQKRYLDYLRSHLDISLADLAYSTTARRMHNSLRIAFVAQTTDDLVKQLELACEKSDSNSRRKAPSAPVIFAFTGQGSQYCGMGHQLWKHSQEFRRLIRSYQAMTSSLGLPHYAHLIAEEDIDMSSVSTIPIQLAIVAIEIAISQLWMSWGLKPDMVIGHSLGEYAALCIAGVLTVSDTFALVGQRAKMIAEAIPPNQAAMLAISGGADEVRQILSSSFSSCGIACLNGPQSTVVSGATEELERLQGHLRSNSTRSTLLRVPYGFHSPQLDPILDQYESLAAGVDFAAPDIPVASALLGRLVLKGDDHVFGASYLRRQAREPVNFVGALLSAQEADIARPGSLCVEVGPDPVCLGLIRANLAATTKGLHLLPTLRRGEDNWATISNSLATVYEAGIMVNWPEYHRDFVSCLSLLDLPTYAFDEKDFWESYPDPDAAPAPAEKKESPVSSVPGFPTSTLQHIARETLTDNHISVVFESLVSEKNLLAAIQAHAVAGVKICSSSVLSDMALSAARYACERLQPGATDAIITIRGLDVRHAIVVMDPSLTQIIQVEAKYSKGSPCVYVYFRAKTEDSPFEEIGVCEIQYSQKSEELGWKNDLFRRRLLIDSRIEALHAATESGQGHRLLRPVVYQLFNGLVEYGARFQGIEEVSLDKDFRDAVGRVRLPPSDGGCFLYNPYLLDAVVHLAGFLANCGLKYPADIAFLSTGFDAWHILRPLSSTALYTSYAYLEESSDGSLLVGDVYVLEDTELVSVLSGLRFQKMKKSALSRILLSTVPASARKNTRFAAEPPADEGYMSGLSTGPSPSAVTTPPSGASTRGTSVDEDPLLVDVFLRAVAAEAGVDLSELQGDTVFADLGVDSLMTITVIASLSKDTGIELPGSFFLDNATVAEAIKALAGDNPDSGCEVSDNELSDGSNTSLEPKEQPLLEDQQIPTPAPTLTPACPPAKPLLLQGSASPNEAIPLFILPDGTGSVSAFVQLPTLAGGRRLYGVESPFTRQDPSTLAKTTVESLVSAFVAAICEIQPEGPYLLAGFAHGATYAFEAARALLGRGHSVQGLLLAGPAPVHAPAELKRSTVEVDHLEQTGLLDNSKRGVRPKKHLTAALQALLTYEPKGLGRRPSRITLIRPTKGLLPAAGTEESNTSPISEWVRDNWRCGTCGWDTLLENIEVLELETDYSSMMRYPIVSLRPF
jgi:iterative type I PKS product template protein